MKPKKEEKREFRSLRAFRETFLPKSKSDETPHRVQTDPEIVGCFMAEQTLKGLAASAKQK